MTDSCRKQTRQAGAVITKKQLNDKLTIEPSANRSYRYVFLLLVFVAMTPLLVLAAEPEAPPPDIVAQFPSLFSWLFGVGMMVICSLIAYTVHSGNKNNEMQWQEIKDLGKRMTAVEIQCAVNHGKGEQK